MSVDAIVFEDESLPLITEDGKRDFRFVRGFEDTDNSSMSIVLEARVWGFRRRYSMHIDSESFRLAGKQAVNTVLVPYIGHLLFGKMDTEDAFYNYLNNALESGEISQDLFEQIVNETINRLKSMHAELYDGGLLNRERRANIALVAALAAGALSLTKSKKALNSLAAVTGGFAGAYIVQKYLKTEGVIRKYRITEDTQFLGYYLARSKSQVL